MPMPVVEPMPPPAVDLRAAPPLLAHDASYFAASARILSFASKSMQEGLAVCITSIADPWFSRRHLYAYETKARTPLPIFVDNEPGENLNGAAAQTRRSRFVEHIPGRDYRYCAKRVDRTHADRGTSRGGIPRSSRVSGEKRQERQTGCPSRARVEKTQEALMTARAAAAACLRPGPAEAVPRGRAG